MILQSVLIAIFGAIIGYFFQQRAWRHKNFEDIRQREFEEGLKLIDGLGRAIDRRLMSLSTFLLEINSAQVGNDEFNRYRESVKEWMHEFSSFKARLFHYFGRDRMLEFENVVHTSLRESNDVLLRTYKFGKLKLSSVDFEEHESVSEKIGFSRYRSFKFLTKLNKMLSNGDIGKTKLYNNVGVGSLETISRVYLVQRLFGLKS